MQKSSEGFLILTKYSINNFVNNFLVHAVFLNALSKK